MKKDRTDRSSVGWLLRVLKGQLGYAALLTALDVYLALVSVVLAWLLRNLVNAAAAGASGEFKKYALFLIILITSQIIANTLLRHFLEYCRSTAENALKRRLFQTILYKEYEWVSNIHSGEWMNRLTNDTQVIAEGISSVIPSIAGMLVRMIGAMILMIYLCPPISWVMLPCGFGLILFSYLFRRTLKKLHCMIQEKDGKLRIFLTESIGSLLVVKSFMKEEGIAAEADTRMDAHREARMRRVRFSNLCNIGFSIVMRGMYLVGVLSCGYGILTNTLSYGNFVAVLQLVGQVQGPLANITACIPKFFAMIASAERLMEAEKLPEDRGNPRSKDFNSDAVQHLYDKKMKGISFDDVSFSYLSRENSCERDSSGDDPVISHLSFQIQKGDYVAITGPSGSGKSTALKLLMGIYMPQSGSVSMLMEDGGMLPPDSGYRALFAYVPQGNQLMSGSIRQVVSFGTAGDRQTEKDIYHALDIACADFVRALPDGLDTVLGERGSGLSEGQMQRIAIARAIYSGRPVLLLDEATSALDEENERRLLMNLRNMTDKTVLIVTHRPAAREICNKSIAFSRLKC